MEVIPKSVAVEHEEEDLGMNSQARTTSSWNIFYPSDFSPASEVAFAHALKWALLAQAELSILHVAPQPKDVQWTDFPGVRHTLERWGILPIPVKV